ncbi:MAG: hypothetical protein ACLR4Z_07890 [Butyricicoccaceae bacterium]
MMKKRMKILAAVLLLPLALWLSAGAAETDAQRERDEAALRSAVTGEAQPYLAGTDGQDVADSFARLLRNAAPDAKSAWAKAAGSLGTAAGIMILTAAARGFSEAAGERRTMRSTWPGRSASPLCCSGTFRACCRSAGRRSTASVCFPRRSSRSSRRRSRWAAAP